MKYNKNSPWGIIDNVDYIADGIDFVSTPSHGGLRLSKDAITLLSEHARGSSKKVGEYYFFEEDCDWALVAFELPHLFRDSYEAAINILKQYHIPYLYYSKNYNMIDKELLKNKIKTYKVWNSKLFQTDIQELEKIISSL